MIPWDFVFETERGQPVHRPEIEELMRAAIEQSGRVPPQPSIATREASPGLL